jgi:AcrR family transcriptional regulator
MVASLIDSVNVLILVPLQIERRMPKILTEEEIDRFRDTLCDLALQSFAKHGVNGITLRGLAAAVGCSRTTPYRYFKNKADILAALRQREFSRMADTLQAAVDNEPMPAKRLVAIASAYLAFAVQHPHAYRVMYEVDQQDSHSYPELMAQIQRSGAPLRMIVEEGVASGAMHGDPENIALTQWAALHGLISLHLSHMLGNERSIEELAEVTIRSLGRAVATQPTTKATARRVASSDYLNLHRTTGINHEK